MGALDCNIAFLTWKQHHRDIYVRPPKDGLPGTPPSSLLQLAEGAFGLREAPRLWFLRATAVLLEAGLEEFQTADACFVLRAPYHKGKHGDASPTC